MKISKIQLFSIFLIVTIANALPSSYIQHLQNIKVTTHLYLNINKRADPPPQIIIKNKLKARSPMSTTLQPISFVIFVHNPSELQINQYSFAEILYILQSISRVKFTK